MTFRRHLPCFLILFTFAMLTWLSINAFAQVAHPGNAPGVSQPGVTASNNPQYQQPASGFPTGGYPNAAPGTATSPTGMPATGTPASGTPAMPGTANAGTTPQNGYMIDRPLGAMQNGPQPANQPQVPAGRVIVPPPEGYNPSKEELDYINRFLTAWNEQSKNIEALDYDFTCQETSSFGLATTYGRVKFRAPDKGFIEIDSELINDKKSFETNKKMKFICTGEAVYEFNFVEKKLTEFVIPPEDRGKGVMDSPLMILIGANPHQLQERFYLMVLQSPASLADCVCLQAWPKWVEDAKEFKYVNVAINRQTFHAKALEVYQANGEGRKGYEITNIRHKKFLDKILPGQINPFSKDDFDRNRIVSTKPRDWTFETKTDFLPEASNQQIAQQNPAFRATPAPVNPQYGTSVNMPTSPTMQGQPGPMTQGTIPPGTTLPGQANSIGTPQSQYTAPPNNVPQYGASPNNNTQRPSNQYMAMPPQGNSPSQSILR